MIAVAAKIFVSHGAVWPCLPGFVFKEQVIGAENSRVLGGGMQPFFSRNHISRNYDLVEKIPIFIKQTAFPFFKLWVQQAVEGIVAY